ncbi:hypothetical protein EDD22DRAFT_867097 [Suillus occidentalis]|nr:hypothetical protein EDD22DRAFT_867097 [Suillus occidentalis]
MISIVLLVVMVVSGLIMVEGRSSTEFKAGPEDLIVASALLHDGIPVRIIDGDQKPLQISDRCNRRCDKSIW